MTQVRGYYLRQYCYPGGDMCLNVCKEVNSHLFLVKWPDVFLKFLMFPASNQQQVTAPGCISTFLPLVNSGFNAT
jgi:hypothetical protein